MFRCFIHHTRQVIILMTNDEIWLDSFRKLVEYINFYHLVPNSKTKVCNWLRAQVYAYQQGKLRQDRYIILEEMAPGIFVNGVSKSLEKAIQNGTKYIKKHTGIPINRTIESDGSPEVYRVTFSNFGLNNFEDLFTLLIKESLGVKYSTVKLDEIYSAIGFNRSEVEDSQSIASNNTSNIVSSLYRQAIKSKIGFGTIELMNRILGTTDLRELLRAAIIFNSIKDLAFGQITPKQSIVIEKAIIGGVPVKKLSTQYDLTTYAIYERIKHGIRTIRNKCSSILTGKNLSYIEKLSPTLEQEAKIFKILYNSIDIANKDTRQLDLLVLFRLGIIGEIGESSSSIELKLAKLSQLYNTVPELIKLRDPKNLDLVKDIDTARIMSKTDNKSSELRVIIPTDSIEVLRLSNRAYNVLMRAGIETVGELRKKAEDADRLSKLRGMGVSTLAEITNKLKELDKR